MERHQLEQIATQVVDAVFEVHKELGPGLLESAYEAALCHEFALRQIRFERQKPVPLIHKGVTLEIGFRIDVLVEDAVVLELKSVEALLPVHEAQLINYLRLANKPLGLHVNFNVPRIKQGIKRSAAKLDAADLRPRDFNF
jgi:GxxExxY protein